MSGTRTYLQQMVDKSSGILLEKNSHGMGEGLLFLGNPQLVFPRLLFEDPVLEPVDRNVWAAIKLAAADSETVTAFPSYDELMLRCNVGSKATIARSISILRSTRWLTVCKSSLRDSQGRVRGNIYALHDEPVQLAETMELDSQYLEWLDGTANGNHSPHPRAVAVAGLVLQGLSGLLASGEDITRLESPVKLRQDALAAIRMIRAGITGSSLEQQLEQQPDGIPLPTLHQRSVAGCIDISKRGYLKGHNRVQKLYPDGKIAKTALSTETVPGWKNSQNSTEYRNCTQPSTETVLRSSSNLNINTTTTREGASTETVLAWPAPVMQLDSNNRALVKMQLATIPGQHHPLVLEVLAAKLAAIADGKAKPLTFGILPYTRRLCELASKGELNPVSIPVADPASRHGSTPVTPQADGQLKVLQGQISHYANKVKQLEELSRVAGVELSGLAAARDEWKRVSLNYQALLQQQPGQGVVGR